MIKNKYSINLWFFFYLFLEEQKKVHFARNFRKFQLSQDILFSTSRKSKKVRRLFTNACRSCEDYEEHHVGLRFSRHGTPLRVNLRRITDTISSHRRHLLTPSPFSFFISFFFFLLHDPLQRALVLWLRIIFISYFLSF